jgi:hypothetical protein
MCRAGRIATTGQASPGDFSARTGPCGAGHRQTGTASISVGWPHSLPTVAWASARANLLPPRHRAKMRFRIRPAFRVTHPGPPTNRPPKTDSPLDSPVGWPRSLPTVAWASARANLLPPLDIAPKCDSESEPAFGATHPGPPIRGHPPTDGPKQTLRWIAPLDSPVGGTAACQP